MAEVIRLVEKLNAAHQLTVTLTPYTVSMMYSDNRCFVSGQKGHIGCSCPVLWLWGIWPLCIGLPQKDSSLRNTVPPRQISFKASIYPKPKGTDHTPPIMVPDIGHIIEGHSTATISTVTEAAVSEGTPWTPHLATTTAHATLQPIDVPTSLLVP